MFEVGGWEVLLVLMVALVVIRPEDLPGAMRSLGAFMRKIRNLSYEFRSSLERIIDEEEEKENRETGEDRAG